MKSKISYRTMIHKEQTSLLDTHRQSAIGQKKMGEINKMEQTTQQVTKQPEVATERKERDSAMGVEIGVLEVEVQTDQKIAQQVRKLIFKTTKGNVTMKPTIETSEYQNGLKVVSKTPAFIRDLPPIVMEIAKAIQTQGSVKVKAFYNIWNTEADGEEVTYRYIQGTNMMNKWEICPPKPKEEEVVA